MMNFSSKKCINVLKREGWFEVKQTGSHKQFKHKYKKGRVTLPCPKKDLATKTCASILKQMGISYEEFKKNK